MKILAAVVTHNRCELLSRCLDHLEQQSRAPDTILVIDNASSDGTPEMLKARGTLTIRQDNLGSAGGWHRAIEHALEAGFDAIWLMDDDGFPDPGALARLEMELGPERSCTASVVVCEDAHERFVFPFPKLNRHGLPVLFGLPRKLQTRAQLQAMAQGGVYPFAHLFNGALISVAAIRKIGNVEPGYFMFGDEVDFFCRLRSQGAVVSVLDALHYHPDVSMRPYSPAKVYYYVKNSLIIHRRYFNLAWLRNLLAVGVVLVRVARRNGLGAALSYLAGRDAGAFYRAIGRGLKGQVGKDFEA
jgi:rhamnopyranosyl-N-acetylglucosaminyl-diphospho-decaprenol beta-1,3/1,4-galactofuranosyltransferase